VSLHILVGQVRSGQTKSLMKRMVSRHARVFPSPVGRDFCFGLCGVRMNKGGSVELRNSGWLWTHVELHRASVGVPPFELRKVPNTHAIDSDIRASIP
jgi:hypothetical protein